MSTDSLGIAATALLLLAVVGPVLAYRLGYRRGSQVEGIVWRKAPEHVVRRSEAERRAAAAGRPGRMNSVDFRPTSRDSTSNVG